MTEDLEPLGRNVDQRAGAEREETAAAAQGEQRSAEEAALDEPASRFHGDETI